MPLENLLGPVGDLSNIFRMLVSYHLIRYVLNMSLNEFDVNVAIDVANDVLPV